LVINKRFKKTNRKKKNTVFLILKGINKIIKGNPGKGKIQNDQ